MKGERDMAKIIKGYYVNLESKKQYHVVLVNGNAYTAELRPSEVRTYIHSTPGIRTIMPADKIKPCYQKRYNV